MWVVVQSQIEGNAERGFTTERYVHQGYATLSAAMRNGLRHFGHDDFNIALVDNGRLVDWTWMGESIGEPPETLAHIAEQIGFTFPAPPSLTERTQP